MSGIAVGASIGAVGATVITTPVIPVLAGVGAAIFSSIGAVGGAFEAGKMAAKQFDKKQQSQKLDLTEEEKNIINATDSQTKTKIETKKSISL